MSSSLVEHSRWSWMDDQIITQWLKLGVSQLQDTILHMYFIFLINAYKWKLIHKNTVPLIASTVYRLLATDLDLLDMNRSHVHFTVLVGILNVEQALPVYPNKLDD